LDGKRLIIPPAMRLEGLGEGLKLVVGTAEKICGGRLGSGIEKWG